MIQIADFMGRPLSDEIIDKIVGLVQVKSMKERFYSAGENTGDETGKKGAFNLMRKGKLYELNFSSTKTYKFDGFCLLLKSLKGRFKIVNNLI